MMLRVILFDIFCNKCTKANCLQLGEYYKILQAIDDPKLFLHVSAMARRKWMTEVDEPALSQ